MRVGLLDLDGTGFPNVALMKVAAWHRSRGDDVRLLRRAEPVDRTYASAVFTWNRRKAQTAADLGAEIGGTGVSLTSVLPDEIENQRADFALYGLDYGVGYLMRGCIWHCAFCVVPTKEGKPRAVAAIDDLLNHESARKRPFVVLLDNEFFWKERWAIAQMQEFTARGIDFCPSQGLDARVVTPAIAETLAAAPYWNLHHTDRQITFAFDQMAYEKQYRRGIELLLAAGIPPRRLQSFVLVGFNSTLDEDMTRIEIIRSYGADPFVMLFRDPMTGRGVEDKQKRHLARWVNRRLYKVCAFREYSRERKRAMQLPLQEPTI